MYEEEILETAIDQSEENGIIENVAQKVQSARKKLEDYFEERELKKQLEDYLAE